MHAMLMMIMIMICISSCVLFVTNVMMMSNGDANDVYDPADGDADDVTTMMRI